MNREEKRVMVDRGFDRSLDVVLDAFLSEGFTVNPTGAGNLHRPGGPGHPRRYAMFEAALPELNFCAERSESPALLGCRVSMFELTSSCTLVTIDEPVAHYPVLAALVPRVTERIGQAVRMLLRVGTVNAA